MLVGHWLCRVDPAEVKVHFLHTRQCEVHVHAVIRPAGSSIDHRPSSFQSTSVYAVKISLSTKRMLK